MNYLCNCMQRKTDNSIKSGIDYMCKYIEITKSDIKSILKKTNSFISGEMCIIMFMDYKSHTCEYFDIFTCIPFDKNTKQYDKAIYYLNQQLFTKMVQNNFIELYQEDDYKNYVFDKKG